MKEPEPTAPLRIVPPIIARVITRVVTRISTGAVCGPALLALTALAPGAAAAPLASAADGARAETTAAARQEGAAEVEALVEAERQEADRLRRRGELRAARRILGELLADEPDDAQSLTLLASCAFDEAHYERALADAQRAHELALSDPDAPAAWRALCARNLARMRIHVGKPLEALDALSPAETELDVRGDPRAAWVFGCALEASGDREGARRLWQLGSRAVATTAATGGPMDWERGLAVARCQRALGELAAASRTLVAADGAARAAGGSEPDVLVELGDLYFEADREVKDAEQRSAAQLFEEARALCPSHEGALLGLFRVYRYNWMRRRHAAGEFLDELFASRPDSIVGLYEATSADVDDGRLKSARERLERLAALAGGRRDVRALEAALAWIDARHDEARAALAELAAESPADAGPERELGRHLLELYRFAEGLPFLRAAVERDPADHVAWTQLGRALANTGDEEAALAALERATSEARGRQDAWRNNTRRVLERMQVEHTLERGPNLSFAWDPRAADVLRTYLVPFYSDAREELAARYGYTPEPTLIEVFGKHADFSVRSTGFEGFPALGVCFGPVVTSVSPLAELRGSFSWARTCYHEFTHVIHLGLSHNRCPRWITEGLATWEEEQKSPAWSRNMRRELVDARANGQIIPVRELNRAFRGPRILFGYYQGGLLCEMLIARHGFAPMVRLLETFDRGLDLDQAFDEVFGTTPEAVDRDFARFVDEKLEGLATEPRWEQAYCARLSLSLGRDVPEDAHARRAWAEGWTTLAFGAWQNGQRLVDAQEALRQVHRSGVAVPRADVLRGEIALADNERERAREIWQTAVESGAQDYRMRFALGSLAHEAGDLEQAEQHWLAAEALFPGFDDPRMSAELSLAELYVAADRFDDEKRALERWLAFNAGDVERHRKVAAWHFDAGRYDEALRFYQAANEVDPFVRRLHRDWGEALFAAGRAEQALREFEVALQVPYELDLDQPGAIEAWEQAELIGWQARALAASGDEAGAAERARAGLALDDECEPCREVLDGLR